MGWLEILTLLALLSGLALMAETFRSQPMWLRIERPRPGPSPRQRRWMGAGVSLLMAGQLITIQLDGATALWTLSLAISGAGLVCMLTAGFRGPTAAEQQRRARVLRGDDPEAA